MQPDRPEGEEWQVAREGQVHYLDRAHYLAKVLLVIFTMFTICTYFSSGYFVFKLQACIFVFMLSALRISLDKFSVWAYM